jgi:hypothetical protein
MSKQEYNFDNVDDESPTIIMGGETYKLKYPTIEEVESVQNLKTDQEKSDAIYNYVIKTKDDQPDFKDLIKKQSIKVLKEFGEMIKAEFGVEG